MENGTEFSRAISGTSQACVLRQPNKEHNKGNLALAARPCPSPRWPPATKLPDGRLAVSVDAALPRVPYARRLGSLLGRERCAAAAYGPETGALYVREDRRGVTQQYYNFDSGGLQTIWGVTLERYLSFYMQRT